MTVVVIRYEPDNTGINPANLIEDELHNQLDPLTKLVIPTFGPYYTESLNVRRSFDDTPLERNVHYVCGSFQKDLTLISGKEVCRSLIIITSNPSFDGPYLLTYQTVGGETVQSSSNMVEAVEERLPVPFVYDWNDLNEIPDRFPSTPGHFEDAELIYGMEYITAALNNIRAAMEIGPYPVFNFTMNQVENLIAKMETDIPSFLDANMDTYISAFKAKFDKAYFNLYLLENMTTATYEEGVVVGKSPFVASQIEENKRMTLDALIGLRESVTEHLITQASTGLGMDKAKFDLPIRSSLNNLANGASVSVVSQAQANIESIEYADEIYPREVAPTSGLTFKKISNHPNSVGGVILAADATDQGVYIGSITNGDALVVDPNWTKHVNVDELVGLDTLIQTHRSDFGETHGLTKDSVGLPLVENNSVVTDEEILDVVSVHKYLTFDGLIRFARTHLLQNAKTRTLADDNPNKWLLDKCVVVFAPGNKMMCKDTSDFPELPPAPEPEPEEVIYPDAGTILSQGCEGFNMVATRADGFGGSYKEIIQINSSACGYQP